MPPRAGPGRPKGSPNKVTTRVRSVFGETWRRLEPEIEDWIRRTAEGEPVPMVKKDPQTGEFKQVLDQAGNPILIRKDANPGKAAEIMMRFAEYHAPKLRHMELSGQGGGSITVKVIKHGEG